jgi:hypothetical protein
MIMAVQDPVKTDGKIQPPIHMKTKDPAEIEERGRIAEAVRLAAGLRIAAAVRPGMEIWSNAGRHSGVYKTNLLESICG